MKRTALVLLCLSIIALLLTGCQGQQQEEVYAEVTQYIGPAATTETTTDDADDTADTTVDTDVTEYTVDDILAEEEESYAEAETVDDTDEAVDPVYEAQTNLFTSNEEDDDTDATEYPYTGSTPIPLDPIDAPTATPLLDLSFTYTTYTATALGLTFEAPAGWVVDDDYSEVYILTEPEAQIKDGQLGVITIYAIPVTSDYSESELADEIEQRIDTIGSLNFSEWNPSLTATRYLMGSTGVYANYSGTLVTGVEVGGRVHATTIDSVLYCIQITYPLNYKEDYMDVFTQLRETIERI